VGVAYAAGDPGVVVVVAQQYVSNELFASLEVGCLSLGTAEVKDGATKALLSVVLNVAQQFFG
jgi:hypothetical protein